jgi:hypothetical protein
MVIIVLPEEEKSQMSLYLLKTNFLIYCFLTYTMFNEVINA